MTVNVLMPALSPTMEEGKLAKWLKAEGDEIVSGDVIAEIETDKATMEVEAVDEGVLGKIVIEEGTEAVKVNSIIAILLEDGEDQSALDGASASPAPAAAPAPTPAAPAAPKAETAAAATPNVAAPAPAPGGERVFASPLARRLAKDRGIDIASVKGSGPRGRIVKADIEGYKEAAAPAAAPKPAPSVSAASVAQLFEGRDYEEVPLDGMRKTIAARLSEAKRDVPHFYLRREIRLDALLALRKTMNASGEARGIKLSVNDFVIKASALALQEHPGCNAVWAGDRVLRFKASDVAVAVAIDGGLFTPVIRDAEAKQLSAISGTMKALATKARDKKLAPQDYQGGSFAISNLGMFGVENFDAVINPPHASILAVGAGIQKPVVTDGALSVATVMSVTLSCDHRVIDGAQGAEFLGSIVSYLEDPMAMLI